MNFAPIVVQTLTFALLIVYLSAYIIKLKRNYVHQMLNTNILLLPRRKKLCIFFLQGRILNNVKFKFNGKSLEIVDEFNYLDVLQTKTNNSNQSKMIASK